MPNQIETPETVQEWVERHGITLDAELIHERPDGLGDNFSDGARHFRARLINGDGNSMTVYFSQGPAVTGWPTARRIVNSLGMDIASVRNHEGDKWGWMEEMGGASERMEAAWTLIQEQAEALERLTSAEAVERLAFDVRKL